MTKERLQEITERNKQGFLIHSSELNEEELEERSKQIQHLQDMAEDDWDKDN